MTNSQCDLTNPNFTYAYCPSNPAAILFAVLFSITTSGHIYQALCHRKPFAGILIMGGLWEAMGYAIRSGSINHPFSTGLNTAQMLLILLAPLWINAFIYMLVGRMIHLFLDDDRVFGVKARKIALMFVIFDVIAFLVQGTGGSLSSATDFNVAKTGLNVYTGGVALQIAFNAIFLAIVGRFQVKAMATLRPSTSSSPQATLHNWKDARYLLILTYSIIIIILIRNFYRLAEFASGLDNTILKHEWYGYVFDAVLMFVAMILLNVFHPGRKLQGPRCDFTEENKALKQAKRERKEAKKAAAKSGASTPETVEKRPDVLARELSADSQV